jgi:DNA polymerase-3 subunit alpha (Gram-positive type)
MISQTPFIIVDLETTGLEPNLDSIVEIGAVKVVNGEIVEEMTTLVHPGIFVPQETTDITGITTEMLIGQPKFEEVIQSYLDFLGSDGVFVAHNAEFDFGFFNSHLRRMNKPELQNPYVCTFKLAKVVHPNLARYGLGALVEVFGIELPQAHRAIHDARATAHLFTKFLKVLQDGGLKHYKDIPGAMNIPKFSAAVEGQGRLF